MLSFVLVAASGGRSLDPASLRRFSRVAAAEVPFPPDDSVTWTNDTATVWFAGWQPPGPDDPETGWHLDSNGLTAVAGRVWPRRDGWKDTGPVPAQLARWLRTEPLVTSADELAGVFMVASLTRRRSSALAADPLGLGLLYWGRSNDLVVLSTRASIAAAVLAEATGSTPRRDPFGAGWLAYTAHAIGPWTGYEGITVVPAAAVVEIDPRGTVVLRRPAQPVWRAGGEALAADPRAALAQAREEMGTALRTALRHRDVDCHLGLTGGKDSRLILALLLADGLAGDVGYRTHGSDDLPDVIVARQLAATFGLRHTTAPAARPGVNWWPRLRDALRAGESSDRELTFRLAASVMSGAQNVGEPHVGRLPDPRSLQLSGLCGESFRTNYAGAIRLRSKRQAARFPHQFGTAGILDRDALARYRGAMHDILFDGITECDTPQDVVDNYFLRQRLRLWVGTFLEVDYQTRVFPLYSMAAIRLAFGIGAETRHAEWIHYQLMRDACEPLVHMPFAKAEWPRGASGDPMKPAVRTGPVPPSPPFPCAQRLRRAARPIRQAVRRAAPARTVNADRRARQRETDVEIMRRYFRRDGTNPAFDLIDATRAQRALDRFDALPERERMEVYGALSAVIWLGGHELALPRELATA
jgi:hypothetical protein